MTSLINTIDNDHLTLWKYRIGAFSPHLSPKMRYIIFAALLQTLVAMILLVFNNYKGKADYLLIALLGGTGCHLLTKFYIFTQVSNPPILSMMHTFVQFAYGPLLYMYAEKKNDSCFLPARLWYFFIPFFMSMTLYVGIFAAYHWFPENASTILDFYNSLTFLPIVMMHIGFGLAIIIKNRNKKNLAEQKLLQILSTLLILIGLTEVMLTIASNSFSSDVFLVRSILYSLLGLVPVFITRYKYVSVNVPWTGTFGNSDLLCYNTTGHVEIVPDKSDELIDKPQERKLILAIEQHQQIFHEIELLVEMQELFKDEDISLDKLASLSGYSRHYISETLNVYAKKSFYHYINECRVREVIKVLDNKYSEDTTLLSIAYNSGFKNKASFNQNFKRIVGTTPSEYLRRKGFKVMELS